MKSDKNVEIGFFLFLFRENPLYLMEKCCSFAL